MGLAARSLFSEPNVVNIADRKKLAYVSAPGAKTRDSDAWYTPKPYIDAARKVLGTIDLDPFSSYEANVTVKAKRIYDYNNSALDNDWVNQKGGPSRVWMNPPYSAGLMSKSVDKLIEQLMLGNVEEAIVLANNATDTKWFKALRERCSAICFTDHRISFESPDGKKVSSNTRGQVFFYFGTTSEEGMEHESRFMERFSSFGWCVSKVRGW